MKAEIFAKKICETGIRTITGVPDSTLKPFCSYIDHEGKDIFENHLVAENEGAAIGAAIGEYLSTGICACVYMQNSGLGNAINPITSLAHKDVYGIPILLIIGWRGEPGTEDEPQHKFMGKITTVLLDILEISYTIIDAYTTEEELEKALKNAGEAFARNKQYAIVVKRGTFEKRQEIIYANAYSFNREKAIAAIVKWLRPDDIVVSTTGKISRELYEQSDAITGSHAQTFLTVGGMGHASMIAYQLAKRQTGQRVICLDGDGAILMHMGSLAVLGSNSVRNMVHICLNNEAHESVGGMPTGAMGASYGEIARSCGYGRVYHVNEETGLQKVLTDIRSVHQMIFCEIDVAIGSRDNLGRPKETAKENKETFMKYIEGIK